MREAACAVDRDKVRDLIIANTVALLSGPSGLASWLRTRNLIGAAASVSLPLDTGSGRLTLAGC